MNILIVEDNASLAGNMIDYLELLEHNVDYAGSGKQCLNLIQEHFFDVIVLDVMMPGMNGYATCRALREQLQCQTPVIFLTAKTELEHKLAGFDAGGDDYLTKPFEVDELMCRIKALALRGKRQDIGSISFGDLTLNTANSLLIVKNSKIRLNNIQYKIIHTLLRNAPETVNKHRLVDIIWGEQQPEKDVLKTHIYQLRKLIGKTYANAAIETDHGRGYRISLKGE